MEGHTRTSEGIGASESTGDLVDESDLPQAEPSALPLFMTVPSTSATARHSILKWQFWRVD